MTCANIPAPAGSSFHFSLGRLEHPQQPWTRLPCRSVGRCRRKQRFLSDRQDTGTVTFVTQETTLTVSSCTSRIVSWKRWGGERCWFSYQPVTPLLTPLCDGQLHSVSHIHRSANPDKCCCIKGTLSACLKYSLQPQQVKTFPRIK